MPEIQQSRLHAFLFQFFVSFFKFLAGVFVEHGDTDITDFGIRQHFSRYRLNLYVVPYNIGRKLLSVFVFQQQLDISPLFAADGTDHILKGTSFRICIIHLQDLIPCFNACFRSGRTFHGRYHYEFLVALPQYHADTAERSVRHLVQTGKALLIQIFGIRIVQAFHQSVHSAFKQFFIGILPHIAGMDTSQRIKELQRPFRVMGHLLQAPGHTDKRH